MATEALYTAGIVARTDQRPLDVIAELAEAMAGQVAFVGNQLVMRAGAYVAPVLALGDDDFAGGAVSVQIRQPRENLFNVVTGKIIDDQQGWKADVDFPEVEAEAYIAADGGVKLPLPVEFGAVHRATQAQQLAAVMLRRERQALTIVARFKLTAFAIELFDTVELTCRRYGWDGKVFEVLNRKWTLEGGIELTLRETDPTIYAFGNAFDAIDASPNTNLPLPHQVQQLAGLAAESGTASLSDGSIITRTRLTWTQATDQSVLQNGKVEVQFHPATELFPAADWPGQFEQGSATETTIVGLRGALAYVFRGRFIGLGGRVRGPWSSPQIVHVVARPPAVGSANLFLNGSFEVATGHIGNDWSAYTAGTTGTVTHSDGVGIFGSRAQRVDCSGLGTTAADRAGYWQGVNLIGLAGKTITQSVYAEGTPGAKVHLYVDWYTASGGSHVGASSAVYALSSDVQRFALTDDVPAGVTYGVHYFWIEQRPGGAGAAYLRIDGAQLELGAVPTAFSASADEALAVAEAALASANAAAIDAAAAIDQLTAISSDSILSPGEKPAAILDYTTLINEQPGIDGQAANFGITTERTGYNNALAALTSYLSGLTGWNVVPGSNVPIVGITWRAVWGAAYAARQTLLNAIANETAKRAQWINVIGIGKPADYATVGKSLGRPLSSWTLGSQTIVTIADGKVGNTALQLAGNGSYPNQGNLTPIDVTKTYRTRFWARPAGGNTAGLLYFSLRQFVDAAGTPGPVNGGRSPYKPSGVPPSTHNAMFGAGAWGEYSYTWTAADWQAGAKFMQPEFLDNYNGAAGVWQVQDFTFEEITEVAAGQTLQLVGRGGCVVVGNTATKSASVSGDWDADVYSTNSFAGGAYAAAVVAQTDVYLMFGLNSDPTTDASYMSLDYAFYNGYGTLYIYESGAAVGSYGSLAVGDVLAVIYDGANVNYMRNSTVVRKVAAPPNLVLFFDSSFATVGASLRGIQFGPMSAVTDIGTSQLQIGAATELASQKLPAGSVFVNNGTLSNAARGTVTYTNDTGAPIGIQMEVSIIEPGHGWNVGPVSVGRISWRYSSSSLGTVKRTMFDWTALQPNGGNIAPLNAMEQVSLPNGETLTWEVVFDLSHTALADLSWTQLITRLAAIKR